MRGAITRHVTTPMGQTLVRSDYGDDDLSIYREVPMAETIEADQHLSTQIIAVVDGDMPAYSKVKADRTYTPAPEAKRGTIDMISDLHPAEAIRTYNNLREPDMWDDGSAHWFGPLGVVSVPVERIRGFNAYVRCNGLIRAEACFSVHPFEDITHGLWEFVRITCTTNHN